MSDRVSVVPRRGIDLGDLEKDVARWLRERGVRWPPEVAFADLPVHREGEGRVELERRSRRAVVGDLQVVRFDEDRFGMRPGGWARVSGRCGLKVSLPGQGRFTLSLSHGMLRRLELDGTGDLDSLVSAVKAHSD